MLYQSFIAGIGHYLPRRIMYNHEFSSELNTSDEWIVSRTGIRSRHIAEPDETTAYMAFKAAEEALRNAGKKAADVDAIIVATTSPDHGFPAVATRVQSLLGLSQGFAFDLQAVCSGFVYGLSVADALIKSGQAQHILLIGAESMSRLIDWGDRRTCILFGDGAGAILLQQKPVDAGSLNVKDLTHRGVLSTHLFSDGSGYDLLYVDHHVQTPNHRGAIMMNGREIFKSAVHKIGSAVETALRAHDLLIEDVDCFVPHQANLRIIQGVIDLFKLPKEKVVVTIENHANTSAASIPLALYTASEVNRTLKSKDLVLIEAMGGGLTWGSALIRW